MKRLFRPILVLLFLLSTAGAVSAEKVADLPAPSGYVNDFAGVLNPQTKQGLEELCAQVDRQAHAQIAVVTIGKLEDEQTIEEFAVELEEKWKVGAKGTDKGLLMVLSLSPRKIRVEVGYGLEAILNDAKVGAILDQMTPALRVNDYNTAIPVGVQALSQVIAADAGVTIAPIQHYYRRVPAAQQQHFGLGQLILGIGLVILVIILIGTGHIGWLFFILQMFLGGGGGRGGGGRGRRRRRRGRLRRLRRRYLRGWRGVPRFLGQSIHRGRSDSKGLEHFSHGCRAGLRPRWALSSMKTPPHASLGMPSNGRNALGSRAASLGASSCQLRASFAGSDTFKPDRFLQVVPIRGGWNESFMDHVGSGRRHRAGAPVHLRQLRQREEHDGAEE